MFLNKLLYSSLGVFVPLFGFLVDGEFTGRIWDGVCGERLLGEWALIDAKTLVVALFLPDSIMRLCSSISIARFADGHRSSSNIASVGCYPSLLSSDQHVQTAQHRQAQHHTAPECSIIQHPIPTQKRTPLNRHDWQL